MNTLKVVLSDHWFDEIKSGRKKHEYRIFSKYWIRRLTFDFSVDAFAPLSPFFRTECIDCRFRLKPYEVIEFQKAYRKNPERMTFRVKNITLKMSGVNTDLKCEAPVFDIELGERIK